MKKILKLIALFCLIGWVMVSCITEQKVQKFVIDNPKTLDKICPKIDSAHKFTTITIIDTIVKEVENDNSYLLELILNAKDIDCNTKLDSIVKACKSTVKYVTINKHTTDTLTVFKDKIEYKEILKEVKVSQWTRTGFWIVSAALILLIIGYIVGRKRLLKNTI